MELAFILVERGARVDVRDRVGWRRQKICPLPLAHETYVRRLRILCVRSVEQKHPF